MEVREQAGPFRHWIGNALDDSGTANLWNAAWREVIGDWLRARHAPELPGTWAKWIKYDNDCERLKWATEDLGALGQWIAGIYQTFIGQSFLGRLRELTGIADLETDPKRYGGGVHLMEPGGWLQPHLDYALHPSGLERRVNLIAFLSPEPDPQGGELALLDDSGRTVVRTIDPEFGRVVIWEAGETAYHGVLPVDGNCPRASLAVYYLAPPRPWACRCRALYVPRRD